MINIVCSFLFNLLNFYLGIYLKNNFYTVFFASERNKYSKSFQLSGLSILVVMFFGILVVIFALFGFFKLSITSSLTKELIDVKQENILLQSLLSDVELVHPMDSSKTYEDFVITYFNNNSLQLPDKLPVDGYVTRGISRDEKHFGLDIAAKFQDKILSPGEGRVIFSNKSEDFGNTIIISHPGGFVSIFAHNDSNVVHAGTFVEKNQLIGYVGETGNSQGPHLHLEMWKNSELLDPREIILDYKKKDVSIN